MPLLVGKQELLLECDSSALGFACIVISLLTSVWFWTADFSVDCFMSQIQIGMLSQLASQRVRSHWNYRGEAADLLC